jgi:phosphinothricin acetyltransferase
VIIREVEARHVPAITQIYAHHVLHGVGTFEEVPPTEEEMAGRLADVAARGLPWLVAEESDGRVLGYAYAGPFRTRSA